MISSATTLPIVLIFERHWDLAPKKLLSDLIPKISSLGYDTLCMEAPDNWNLEDLKKAHKTFIEDAEMLTRDSLNYLCPHIVPDGVVLSDLPHSDLIHLLKMYVTTKNYELFSEHIKNLPGRRLLYDVTNEASHHHINVKGIDIDSDKYYEMIGTSFSDRMSRIVIRDDERVENFTRHIKHLTASNKGVIFLCGALHVEKVVQKIQDLQLNRKILYYFPHSSKKFDKMDDIQDLLSCAAGKLEGHTHLATTDLEISSLAEKILEDIRQNSRPYQKELAVTSHTALLNDLFKVNFRAFKLINHHVDALLDVTEITSLLITKLQAVKIDYNIFHYEERYYLVIPQINSSPTAEKILSLKQTF